MKTHVVEAIDKICTRLHCFQWIYTTGAGKSQVCRIYTYEGALHVFVEADDSVILVKYDGECRTPCPQMLETVLCEVLQKASAKAVLYSLLQGYVASSGIEGLQLSKFSDYGIEVRVHGWPMELKWSGHQHRPSLTWQDYTLSLDNFDKAVGPLIDAIVRLVRYRCYVKWEEDPLRRNVAPLDTSPLSGLTVNFSWETMKAEIIGLCPHSTLYVTWQVGQPACKGYVTTAHTPEETVRQHHASALDCARFIECALTA